ncbi:DNA translocase SpoIIIE [Caprobacter fermentans]|uniref:DNA translocase SpoIIIE n=1 Tax=Caproicibacter fermentans TaxID=2576756 RepID=A0A6N8I2F0_9FIRM|nr:DNA translocase FtsK [Caproicibacter fermentans]MVB11850.1 DNA translocase SpoIIIE [Caproicibacter fermentans]
MANQKNRKKRAAKPAVKKTASAKNGASAAMRSAQANKQKSQIYAVVLFACSILMFCLVLISGDHIWHWFHNVLLGLFGSWAILWPVLLLYISIITALERQGTHTGGKLVLMIVIIALFCASAYIFSVSKSVTLHSFWTSLVTLYTEGTEHAGSGFFSGLLGIPIVAALGPLGSKIVILLLLFVAIMVLTGTSLIQLFRTVAKPAGIVKNGFDTAREKRIERNRENLSIDIALDDDGLPLHPVRSQNKKPLKKNEKLEQLEKVFSIGVPSVQPEQEQKPQEPCKSASDGEQAEPPVKPDSSPELEKSTPEKSSVKAAPPAADPPQDGEYHTPPISMLETTRELSEQEAISEIQTNGRQLVDTLNSFGVQTSFVGYSRGPAVTRYELQPASGVKISKITNLSDDLSMNLATAGLRIEAPIPGKAAVGIEVPNKKNTVVRMRELIESNSFTVARSHLTVALGRDIAGGVAVSDLAKMPHLLIAGATGSGKSVCINSMIISLLYKSSPEDVRFLMIDPKVVELGIYNGIPHLLVPVVTDPRKAAGALGWAVNEMLKRYKIFAARNVRDLSAYNSLAAQSNYQDDEGQPMEHMPQIVIIIDELADLMMAAPNEVEDSICRLAQMARAAGMHLVIATQRPSVDVITGIIKANIPSRIAFAVSSQVDSRTILDMGGAEKLLGRGDMLFSPVGSQKPIRIQGCFVSDSEIESIVGFVKKSQEADYNENIAEEIERNAAAEKGDSSSSGSEESGDPMMPDAIKCIVEAGQASTSLLQRRLRLGYARAGRLIDEMEQMGVVGPRDGSKPRQVLITHQQYLEMNMQKSDSEPETGT